MKLKVEIEIPDERAIEILKAFIILPKGTKEQMKEALTTHVTAEITKEIMKEALPIILAAK